MYVKRNKKAFTLAEVMVVLLILTILFAAFAPFLTKRARRNAGNMDLWRWSTRNLLAGPMDAYYEPDDKGGVYFGATPNSDEDILNDYTPLSRAIIRSGYINNNIIQRQLQLRFGRNDKADSPDYGQFAGTFLADGNNMLFGAYFPLLNSPDSNKKYPEVSDVDYPVNNVSFGFGALNNIGEYTQRAQNNTAFGYNALNNNSFGSDNTAIGAGAGAMNSTGSKNTFIGYNAGSHSLKGHGNTLVGANSNSSSGSYNTFIGANTGNQYDEDSSAVYNYNVAIGYNALSHITSGNYNNAVGANALKNLTTGSYNTAVGYNACANITDQSGKTCIGYNSGPSKTYAEEVSEGHISPRTELGNGSADNTQVTYIGDKPKSVFGGDAVMEIYNPAGAANNYLINNPDIKSNTTTIINGNLIVRGKTYFTVGNVLYPFYYDDVNGNQIFGAKLTERCAPDQLTYNFSTTGKCSELSDLQYSSSSDRRLKNITSRNNDGYDKIKQLKVYNYTFKNDKEHKPHVGVIAQELQKVFPNSVFTDENGYLKIRWDEMFFASINAIKELNNKVVAMVKENLSLEKKITKLEKRNEELNKQVETLSIRVNTLKKRIH